MKKHFYAITESSKAHDVALAFNSQADRARYLADYGGNGAEEITAAEAKKYNEIRHFYGRTENDWHSQLYPKHMW